MNTWQALIERYPNITPAGAALIMRVPPDRADKSLRNLRQWGSMPMHQRLENGLPRIAADQAGCIALAVPISSTKLTKAIPAGIGNPRAPLKTAICPSSILTDDQLATMELFPYMARRHDADTNDIPRQR